MMTQPLMTNDAFDLSPQTEGLLSLIETGSNSLRRDLASFGAFDRAEMIRFVLDQEARLIPDIEEKLPGRGFWVRASADALRLALKKNAFSRAAKRQVASNEGLIDHVAELLRRRVLSQLGLSRRDGSLITGFEKVRQCLKNGLAEVIISAQDGAADGRSKVLRLARATNKKIVYVGCFSCEQLELALGLENAIHAALVFGPRIKRILADLKRFEGFVPLVPQEWAQEKWMQDGSPEISAIDTPV